MTDLIRGVSTPRLKVLRELLWEWAGVLERTTRIWTDSDDAAWAYNERATLSLLAGAVWRLGGIAFEEYANQKNDGTFGRCDLYFQTGRRDFVAEAKQCWASASPTADPAKAARRALESSARQVGAYRSYGYDRLGIAFACAYLPTSKAASVNEHLEHWLSELRRVPHDCIAWSFPEKARRKSFGNELFPGLAIVIRQV